MSRGKLIWGSMCLLMTRDKLLIGAFRDDLVKILG